MSANNKIKQGMLKRFPGLEGVPEADSTGLKTGKEQDTDYLLISSYSPTVRG